MVAAPVKLRPMSMPPRRVRTSKRKYTYKTRKPRLTKARRVANVSFRGEAPYFNSPQLRIAWARITPEDAKAAMSEDNAAEFAIVVGPQRFSYISDYMRNKDFTMLKLSKSNRGCLLTPKPLAMMFKHPGLARVLPSLLTEGYAYVRLDTYNQGNLALHARTKGTWKLTVNTETFEYESALNRRDDYNALIKLLVTLPQEFVSKEPT